MLMSAVWFFISNRGLAKLAGLVPAFLFLLFFYWWLVVNELLEEIHEDKKAEAAALEEFYGLNQRPVDEDEVPTVGRSVTGSPLYRQQLTASEDNVAASNAASPAAASNVVVSNNNNSGGGVNVRLNLNGCGGNSGSKRDVTLV